MLTPVSIDDETAVYSSLPAGLGLQVGMIVQDANNGQFRQLVQHDPAAGAALGIGFSVKYKAAGAPTYVVQQTTALVDFIKGSNSLAGVTIPAGSYFWMHIKGQAEINLLAGVVAGTIVASSVTAGKPTTALVADIPGVRQANIIALTASPGGGGLTLCEIF